MKRLIALTVVGVLVLSGVATATLTKESARLAAELEAFDYASKRPHTSGSQIGACKRLSSHRVSCSGRADGDDFIDCDSYAPYACHYVAEVCTFRVAVHEAGYSSLGRIQGAHCTTREHTG